MPELAQALVPERALVLVPEQALVPERARTLHEAEIEREQVQE